MGAMSDTLRDEFDSQMSTIIGAPYDALANSVKTGLFTALANALEVHVAEFAPTGTTTTWVNAEGDTVTVTDGIITSVA
jgi:hypothetical protein